MWNSVGKLLAKLAGWALGHPDELLKVAKVIIQERKDKK